MKLLRAFTLCCIVPLSVSAHNATKGQQDTKPAAPASTAQTAKAQTPAEKTTATGVDSAKEAAIRKLFEVQDMRKNMQQVVDGMSTNIKPMLLSSLPKGEYRDQLADLFIQKFQTKLKIDQLMEMAVPIYAKYFSVEDIEGLTKFYQTPLGKKTLSVLPQTVIEMQTASMQLGQKVGRESMEEVLTEHPDLKKALEDAAAAPGN